MFTGFDGGRNAWKRFDDFRNKTFIPISKAEREACECIVSEWTISAGQAGGASLSFLLPVG